MYALICVAVASRADGHLNHKAALDSQPTYKETNSPIFAGDNSAGQWYWAPFTGQIDWMSLGLAVTIAAPMGEAMYLYSAATKPPSETRGR